MGGSRFQVEVISSPYDRVTALIQDLGSTTRREIMHNAVKKYCAPQTSSLNIDDLPHSDQTAQCMLVVINTLMKRFIDG